MITPPRWRRIVTHMSQSVYSRRQILATGLGGAAALTLGSSGAALAKAAGRVEPAGSDLGAIEHVVFLMLENRSFDHYFGSLRGVQGFNDHPMGNPAVFSQPWPGGRDSTLLPFHLDTSNSLAECTFDLAHTWNAQHDCWNAGAMDSFVSTHTSNAFEGPGNGILTMGYYTREDLAFSYALADTFTICDRYFCSVLGPTHPNRLFALSGTNDPDGLAGGPVLITNPDKSAQFSASWESMPERLSAAGVPWKVYNPPSVDYLPGSADATLISDNILLYFQQYSDPIFDLYNRAFLQTYPKGFHQDVRSHELPAVSWITPPLGADSHPPAAPAVAEAYIHSVLNILFATPKIWKSTVLFITFDENDGFFDHVAPPTPPPNTPGESRPSTRCQVLQAGSPDLSASASESRCSWSHPLAVVGTSARRLSTTHLICDFSRRDLAFLRPTFRPGDAASPAISRQRFRSRNRISDASGTSLKRVG